LVLTFWYSRSF